MMGDNVSGVKTAEAIAEEKRKKELKKQQKKRSVNCRIIKGKIMRR